MRLPLCYIALLAACIPSFYASTILKTCSWSSLLSRAPKIAAAGLLFSLLSTGSLAHAASTYDVYFGVGCFWHVQHEFIEAELKLLQRDDTQLTVSIRNHRIPKFLIDRFHVQSVAGYAGGIKQGKDGLICYHNMLGASDYG
jgi:hypothetical protein